MAISERTKLQKLIKQRYPDLVEKNQSALCSRCCFSQVGSCDKNLLPVTTGGQSVHIIR
jgi:hypothetical protein